jgi:hypothetical protein
MHQRWKRLGAPHTIPVTIPPKTFSIFRKKFRTFLGEPKCEPSCMVGKIDEGKTQNSNSFFCRAKTRNSQNVKTPTILELKTQNLNTL